MLAYDEGYLFTNTSTIQLYNCRSNVQLGLEKLPYPNEEKTLISRILFTGSSNSGTMRNNLLSNLKTSIHGQRDDPSVVQDLTLHRNSCGPASPSVMGKLIPKITFNSRDSNFTNLTKNIFSIGFLWLYLPKKSNRFSPQACFYPATVEENLLFFVAGNNFHL